MGCDIHFYVERLANTSWQQCFIIPGSKSYDSKYWYSDRNYDLFGLLSGIRRSWIIPLSSPRGLPKDLSKSLQEEWKNWEGDGHTPSYYLLSELLAAGNNTTIIAAMVDLKNYVEFKEKGYPSEWSGDLVYSQSNKISNKEMDRLAKLLAFNDGKEYYTEIAFEFPIKLVCESFWDETLEKIAKLDSNPDNIRCVFWFDN